MKNSTKKTGLVVKSSLKSGAIATNHGKAALKVKSGARAGGIFTNPNRSPLVVAQ